MGAIIAGMQPNFAMRRRHLLCLHRYVGLILGAWFVVLGLSGSVLVYQEEIDRWLNPSLLHERGDGEPLPAADILIRAEAHFPRAAVERMRTPRQPGDVYRLLIREHGARRIGSPRLEASLSPTSGELLGTRPVDQYGVGPQVLMRTIYDLHHKVLLGNEGKTAVGIVGLGLLTTLIFGVVLGAANIRRLGLKGVLGIRITARPVRVLYDVHRSCGLLAATVLLLSTVTGFTLVFPDYARDMVGVFSRVTPFPTVPFARADAGVQPPGFAEHWERVSRVFPLAAITEVHLPLRATSGYLFYIRSPGDAHRLGDTLVWVDPRSGAILLTRSDASRSGGEQFLHWLLPLHSGVALGEPGKLLMCIAGLMPMLLACTGVLVWMRKRRVARLEDTRRLMLRRNKG